MLIHERISGPDTLLKLYAAIDDGLKTVQRQLDTKQFPRDPRGGRPELSAAEVLTMMVGTVKLTKDAAKWTTMSTQSPDYHGYRFPPEIISYAVWLYHRFCLSLRDVEELLADRGVTVSYEAVRQWCLKFGPSFAKKLRHQVIEVPAPAPQVTEYQVHRLACARCGLTTCGTLPAGVLGLSYGPRLAGLVGLCRGAYRMSKRMMASFCTEVLGVPLALGEVYQVEQTVATVLDPPVQEVRAYVQTQNANVDETDWRQQQRRAWLWIVVTQWVSVFCIRVSRGAKVLRELVGAEYGGVLTSDRAKAYTGQPLPQRQICWAHLRRDFQARIDRGGAGAPVGEMLLEQANVLGGWWHWVRDGTWSRATFRRYAGWLRGVLWEELVRGTRCACPKIAATCQELLKVEAALWTFVRVPGIEPTNNAAERGLRHAVQWRKTSYGTDSVAGSHFVENILTFESLKTKQSGRPRAPGGHTRE